MAYSNSQNKATQKYIKNAYDEIKIRVPKGKKALYQKKIGELGMSLNSFIVSLIERELLSNFDNNQIVEPTSSVKQVAATMAVEDMYFTKDFLNQMIKVASGELSSENVRREVLQKYER